MIETDFTHDPSRKSWVESANHENCPFPIQNLPFVVFEYQGRRRIGVGIGYEILDLAACLEAGLLPEKWNAALGADRLNTWMASSVDERRELRHRLSRLLGADEDVDRAAAEKCLVPRAEARLVMPCDVRDYSDFYASIFHATNVGSMFRPNNPLLPNYKHIPIGYHGRASSVVPSGTPIRRPVGQKAPAEEGGMPTRSPSALLDYELEVGFFVGQGNALGTTIPISKAEDHLFGMCLVNDWSARDIQKWEYQPLGPFLAKSFGTTISPWVITMEALIPFRVPCFARPDGDPQPLEYLTSDFNSQFGGVDIQLEVYLTSRKMRESNVDPVRLSRTSFTNMYWTIAQMLTHHASNGCNLQPGDLMASGTVSGPTRDQRGCLLELTWNGDAQNPLPGTDRTPIELPTGELRKFLEDGDQVIMKAFCERDGFQKIGFGACEGEILPAETV